jgi:hypothetical protein
MVSNPEVRVLIARCLEEVERFPVGLRNGPSAPCVDMLLETYQELANPRVAGR